MNKRCKVEFWVIFSELSRSFSKDPILMAYFKVVALMPKNVSSIDLGNIRIRLLSSMREDVYREKA